MDRTLGEHEQQKVHTARTNCFQVNKRKNSTTQDPQLEDTPATSGTMSSSKRFRFPGMTSTKPSGRASSTPLIVRFYDADIQARDAHDRTQEQILAWPNSELERCHNYIQMLFPVPEGSAFNWEAPIIDRETMETFRARSDLRNRLRRSLERMLDFYGFKVSPRPEEDEAENDEEQQNVKAQDESNDLPKSCKHEGTSAEVMETAANPKETTKDIPELESEENASKPSFSSEASSGYYVIRAPHWRKSFRTWAVRFDHNHLRITRILRCLRVLGLQTECDAFFDALKRVFEDPTINISGRSMTYWTRAVTRPLYVAPDDDEIEWLQEWEEEQEAAKEVEGKGRKSEVEKGQHKDE